MTTEYISEQEFLNYIKSPSETGDPNVIAAISAAQTEINGHCGRSFDLGDDPETRYFTPCSSDEWWIMPIDDVATLEDLVVSTSPTGSSSYSALTIGTDFIAEPTNGKRNGISGWPYDRLRAVGGSHWPTRLQPYWRDTMQITATFGWAEVPNAVQQATKILAALYYKLGEAPLGVAGFDQFGSIRVREVPQAAVLLSPFVLQLETAGIA